MGSSLRVLGLAVNRLGDAGAKVVADAFAVPGSAQSSRPIELNLNSNFIGDDGAMALGRALAANASFASISLEYNKIEGPGIQALADGRQAQRATLVGQHVVLKCGWNPAGATANEILQ